MRKYLKTGAVAAVLVAAVAGYALVGNDNKATAQATGEPIVAITVPEVTGQAALGKIAFEANCAACHGQDATGVMGKGPPLVHKIYEPSHHGDIAFLLAAQNGVRAHHWRFGNMPPVEGVSPDEIAEIVIYIRTLQRANGIR